MDQIIYDMERDTYRFNFLFIDFFLKCNIKNEDVKINESVDILHIIIIFFQI
jgi:hypothetical protein